MFELKEQSMEESSVPSWPTAGYRFIKTGGILFPLRKGKQSLTSDAGVDLAMDPEGFTLASISNPSFLCCWLALPPGSSL